MKGLSWLRNCFSKGWIWGKKSPNVEEEWKVENSGEAFGHERIEMTPGNAISAEVWQSMSLISRSW